MNYMKDFIIPFSGLKAGIHEFPFEIDNKFFEHFEYSEIRKGDIHVDCRLEKHERMMILDFEIAGTVKVACDRCAGEFDLPLEGSQKLIVKLGQDYEEESEEILVINEKDYELDISQYLYEYIHLLLPIQKIHGNDANGNSLCDPEVIRFIIEEEEHPTDSRWDVLKTLKNKKNKEEN